MGEWGDIARLIAYLAVVFYVVTRVPALRAIAKYWDQYEPEQRRKVLWAILKPRPGSLVMRQRAMAKAAPELMQPADADVVREVDARASRDWLLTDRTCLAALPEGMHGLDLDAYGSVLMGQTGMDGRVCSLEIRLRDRRRVSLVEPGEGVVVFDASFGASRVVWWQAALGSSAMEMWQWAPDSAAHPVARVPLPEGVNLTTTARVTAVGDVAVGTFARTEKGSRTIAVRLTDGAVSDLGLAAFPTVFRDLGAEQRGRCAVTFVQQVPHVAMGDLSLVNLDVWPPAVTPLRREVFPGASAYLGEPVGWWRSEGLIEVPGRVHLSTPKRVMAHEVVYDGAWLTTLWRTTVDASRLTSTTQGLAVHPATGATVEVTPSAYGPLVMRGEWIMWRESPHESLGYPVGAHSTWVGRLLDPTTTPGPRDA